MDELVLTGGGKVACAGRGEVLRQRVSEREHSPSERAPGLEGRSGLSGSWFIVRLTLAVALDPLDCVYESVVLATKREALGPPASALAVLIHFALVPTPGRAVARGREEDRPIRRRGERTHVGRVASERRAQLERRRSTHQQNNQKAEGDNPPLPSRRVSWGSVGKTRSPSRETTVASPRPPHIFPTFCSPPSPPSQSIFAPRSLPIHHVRSSRYSPRPSARARVLGYGGVRIVLRVPCPTFSSPSQHRRTAADRFRTHRSFGRRRVRSRRQRRSPAHRDWPSPPRCLGDPKARSTH